MSDLDIQFSITSRRLQNSSLIRLEYFVHISMVEEIFPFFCNPLKLKTGKTTFNDEWVFSFRGLKLRRWIDISEQSAGKFCSLCIFIVIVSHWPTLPLFLWNSSFIFLLARSSAQTRKHFPSPQWKCSLNNYQHEIGICAHVDATWAHRSFSAAGWAHTGAKIRFLFFRCGCKQQQKFTFSEELMKIRQIKMTTFVLEWGKNSLKLCQFYWLADDHDDAERSRKMQLSSFSENWWEKNWGRIEILSHMKTMKTRTMRYWLLENLSS